MTSGWFWRLRKILRQLWVRALAYSLLGVATALGAVLLKPYIPPAFASSIGADAVDDVLTIIASSMLAVTTFTLSIMVQAFGGATQTATPRATSLLVQDQRAQSVLATFLGSFLFALVGIVALKTGIYGDTGRVVLFGVTLVVIFLIVSSLISWFDHLTTFGRLDDTAARVEAATAKAIRLSAAAPFFGARPLRNPAVDIPAIARHVSHDTIGYVQHVDMGKLQACADASASQVFVQALPGAFVDPSRPILAVVSDDPENLELAGLRAAFTIGPTRTYDQDPRFGLCVLSEIASRALSPAVNDPGTAIDIIGRQQRLLTVWANLRREAVSGANAIDAERGPTAKAQEGTLDQDEAPSSPKYRAVYAPAYDVTDLMDDAFRAIARDGASLIEVVVRLQKALASLAAIDDPVIARAASEQARSALTRARDALSDPGDLARISRIDP